MVNGVSDGVSDGKSSSAISVTGGVEVSLKVDSVGYVEDRLTEVVTTSVLGKRVSVGNGVMIHWFSLIDDTPSDSRVIGGSEVTSKEVL